MTRFARYVLIPCACIVLALAACTAPPAIDGPPPGASQHVFQKPDAQPAPIEPSSASVWLGILVVAAALGAGTLLLVSRRPPD